MGTVDIRTHAVRLTQAECWKLLGAERVGRLAVVVGGHPVVYPVNHLTEDDAVVIRSEPGGKVAGLHDGAPVAFEVDRLEPDGRTGWSVLLKAVARPLADPSALRLGPREDQHHWVRLQALEITGRRVRRTAEDNAWRDDTATITTRTTFAPEWGETTAADDGGPR